MTPYNAAAIQWRSELEGWAIPEKILAAAPETPWGFPVDLFKAPEQIVPSPSRARALDRLADGGSVLDVGCGGGAAALALVPPAGLVVGFDASAAMLAEFAAHAERCGVAHREIEGSWPADAERADMADVVACHHVLYNVPDLPPFVDALSAAARRRVVVELTSSHPLVATRGLWQHFHGIDRPGGPTADLAFAALSEMGLSPQRETWSRPPRPAQRELLISLNRRRLCLPVSAEPEVDRVMGEWDGLAASRDMATIWWDLD